MRRRRLGRTARGRRLQYPRRSDGKRSGQAPRRARKARRAKRPRQSRRYERVSKTPPRQLAQVPRIGAEEVSLRHRSEEHTSELQSHLNLVCRLLLEKKKNKHKQQRLKQR